MNVHTLTTAALNQTHMPPCVLTLGKFETLHKGHATLLATATTLAHEKGLKSAAMVFHPSPYVYFSNPHYQPVFTLGERLKRFEHAGIDDVLCYTFDQDLANLSALDFCRIIFDICHAHTLVVGENYRFGTGRSGDIALLKKEALYRERAVEVAPSQYDEAGNILSTSHIRECLQLGKLPAVNQRLGFPYFVCGVVTQGRQLGRTIGFPTLNIYPPKEKQLPPYGVYQTTTTIAGKTYNSITNIGLRPTVEDGNTTRNVETHLFHYEGESLYGQEAHVAFHHFIRPEAKFASLEALKLQIQQDILACEGFTPYGE